MDSVWHKGINIKEFPALEGNCKTGTLIIGGGLAGLLTAYMLEQEGAPYMLIEAERIGQGATRNTTAKITAQHGIIYSKLTHFFGVEKAAQYLKANLDAIDDYENIIKAENIDCDFKRISSFLYSAEGNKKLAEEYSALKKLGYNPVLHDKINLPAFAASSALEFQNQAEFHPLKFIAGICGGLNIFEKTRALSIKGNCVQTGAGVINAEKIIIASHFPFVNSPGYYFMRMHQDRSYVLALENADFPDGAYLGIDGGKYSFRKYGGYLLLGGMGHRCGENKGVNSYDSLRQAAKKLFSGCRVAFQWSAEDCMTHDGIPYIGSFSAKSDSVLVATGFNKWGMTSSMAAAKILRDMVTGKESSLSVFSPQRHNLRPAFPGLVADAGKAVSGLSKSLFYIPLKAADSIMRGEGQIVSFDGKKAAVYKDHNGALYVVSAKCPHLGCQLEWNPAERSWDCPCHGSRFDYKGNLLDGPASINIK